MGGWYGREGEPTTPPPRAAPRAPPLPPPLVFFALSMLIFTLTEARCGFGLAAFAFVRGFGLARGLARGLSTFCIAYTLDG